VLVAIWCVAKNLQLGRAPWWWCQCTPKRIGTVNWYVIWFTRCILQVLINKWWQSRVSTGATIFGTLSKAHTSSDRQAVRLHDFRFPLRCKRGPRSFATLHNLAVCWGTAIQVGRYRVRLPMVSLEIFIYIIFPAALWLWSWLSL
jgi:hypothetical protein